MPEKWDTCAGHSKFVRLFDHPDCRFELSDEAKSFDWWSKNFKSARTFQFPYRCCECGFSGRGTTMDNFVRTGRAKCMCKSSCQVSRYPTAEYHRKFLDTVAKIPRCDAGPLNDFSHWSSTVRSSQQTIALTCTTCGMTTRCVKLFNFLKYGRFGCFCTGSYDVTSEEARQYVVRVLQRDDHSFNPGPGVLDSSWWSQNVVSSHSKMEVFCTVCQVPTWVGISQFVTRKSALCGCKWKTEALVTTWFFELVQSRFPRLQAVRQYSHVECAGAQKYRFDLALKNPQDGIVLVAIEVDGPQHFCPSFGESAFESLLQRDLTKEQWCLARGIPLLRVSQRSVWYNRFDWQEFIARNVESAVAGQLTGVVVEPNCVSYVSGRYASVRE